ncbi:hypothetical protein [Candidatus Enterococcus clewellii]|uniref:Conjugal transfer protein n=1 Tax=Candidatus Enterococcus clewellii TaxID=1834193 RepID=A0A242K8E2_9ENTE|nr:hypothetical protein [Enterococcus sp. 9E7_DIV0242]OTP17433.1 hypothetical protein A5888_001571 [Enterococcus sp. 9E7_DIV0242]
MNLFQNVFNDFVGDAKYLVMLAILVAAAYLAYERKVSKAVPIVGAIALAVWFVGDTAGVFQWLLDRMTTWGR